MLLRLLAFMLTWVDTESNHSSPKKIYRSPWNKVLEDCPDPSCAVVFDETEYLSYLQVRFVPERGFDLMTRRYMWLYTKEMQEVGRIIISEHEGYWVQINAQPATCDNDIKFTSTNLTNTEVDFRYITIRVTDNGVHITFPDKGTWAVCAEWRIQRIGFDNWWKLDARYATISNDTSTDFCAAEYNNGTESTDTPYCTEEGFCKGYQMENMCENIDNSTYCKSSNIKHTVSCNSTTHCIAPNWVCNGYEDCSNGEDELDCPSPEERRCKGQLLDDGTCWIPQSQSSAKKRLFNGGLIAILSIICLRTI